MSSGFYLQTTQNGAVVELRLFAVAGTGVVRTDYRIAITPSDTQLVSFVGPEGWTIVTNPQPPVAPAVSVATNGTVTVTSGDETNTFVVGSGADGLVGTFTLQLASPLSALAGTLTINHYDEPAGADGHSTVHNYPSLSLAIPAAAPCFLRGTRLNTPKGLVAVERIMPGELVSLARGGTAAVVWIGHRDIDCTRHPNLSDVTPVRVRAGALGPGKPEHDVLLSPDHSLFLDGMLIPVRYLKNGTTVVDAPMAHVSYYHVELAQHDILMAEGMAVESFLDTGNRGAFVNAQCPIMIHPTFALHRWAKAGCAQLLLDGPRLVTVRRALQAWAEDLGYGVTQDPDLRVEIAGVCVPVASAGRVIRVDLHGRSGLVHIRSHSMVPAELGLVADHRRLGVALTGIALDGVAVRMDDPCLTSGWHAAENGVGGTWRWTDGDATLKVAGAVTLEFEVAISASYCTAPALPERRVA